MTDSSEPRDPILDAPDDSDDVLSDEELRTGTIDFDFAVRPAMGSGAGKLHKMSDPISGGSIISWAELLRHQQQHQGSDAEVALGSLPEIQIDAMSDKDIVKHLEREARNAPAKAAAPPVVPPTPSGGSLASKLFNREAPNADDWMLDIPKFDTSQQSSSIDLRTAAKASADAMRDGDSHRTDESDILTHAMMSDDGNSAVNLGDEPRITGLMSNPSLLNGVPRLPVALDGPQSSAVFPAATGGKRRQPRPLTSWLGAASVGIAAGCGLAFGVWYGKKHAPIQRQIVVQPQAVLAATPAALTVEAGRKLLEAGESDAALAAFGELPDHPEVLLGRGQARWLSYVRQQRLKKVAPIEQDREVTAARRELATAHLAEGFVWLGLINETFRQTDQARNAYRNGLEQFPDQAKLFHAALARVDALAGRPVKLGVARMAPELGLALSLILVNQSTEAAVDEAGFDYWRAIGLARQQKFPEARAALLQARAAHDERRGIIPRQGLNPGSDPREDIFLHDCDQLLAFWDVQAKLHAQSYMLDGQSPAQAVEALLASHNRLDRAFKAVSVRLNVQKPEQLASALDAVIAERKKAEVDFQQAERALRMVREGANRSDEMLAAVRKTADDDTKAALTKLEAATAREAAARQAVAEMSLARKAADDTLQALTNRLRAAKLIGERAGTQEILTAVDRLLVGSAPARQAEVQKIQPRIASLPQLAETPDPELAERSFSTGMGLYFARQYERAEVQLLTALRHDQKDARIVYFLGLTRLAQGQTNAADKDFRQAAALERQGLPNAQTVNAAFERVQGPERHYVNRFRQ